MDAYSNNKKPVVALVGPTASGKTALSIALAKATGGEIVCADSMQIYQDMEIGSAKPTPEEMAGVPHHMLSVVSPFQSFSAAAYQEMGRPILEDIVARGKLPLVVGGTGLFIDALLRPMTFGDAPAAPALRAKLEAEIEQEGIAAVYKQLIRLDPASAERIHQNDRKRIVRALEVILLTGKPLPPSRKLYLRKPMVYNTIMFALDWPRECLYQRIDQRVDQMLKDGLLEEVAHLKKMGCNSQMQSMQGLGYKELLGYLDGACSLEEAVAQIKQDSRRYAKRQLTWFKADPLVQWLPGQQPVSSMVDTVLAALKAYEFDFSND